MSKNGKVFTQTYKGHIVASFVASKYEHIKIRGKHILVHRAVLESFVDNPDPDFYTDVNHKDLNKLNNNLDNLEWCNRSQNIRYSIENDSEFLKMLMRNLKSK